MSKPLSASQIKAFGRVGVLYGGVTAEREVSIMSGENVLHALQAKGVDAFPVIIGDNPVAQLLATPMDRAFNVLHGKLYEDGQIQGVLDLLKIPYPGSGVLASALTFDKKMCKMIWQAAGLHTPPMVSLSQTSTFAEITRAIGSPYVIKPACEGSSLGVHIVRQASEHDSALKDAFHYGDKVIAEKFIEGGEYTVSFLNDEPLPAIKIETPNAPFYDYHAKYYSDDTQYLLPCGLSEADEKKLNALVLQAYHVTHCQHWARVDVMRDKATGEFWLIELNTIPGMTSHSLLPKAAAAIGLDFETVCVKILENTLTILPIDARPDTA